MDTRENIIIVGAGVFGLSTALQLAEDGYISVTVLDRSMPPVPDGSSNDISRVIRFDYGDKVYAEMGKEAYDLWNTHPDYEDSFHKTPCVWTAQQSGSQDLVQSGGSEYIRKTKEILTNMGAEWHGLASAEELKRRFPAVSGNPIGQGFEGFYNTSAGWADAGVAIAGLRDRCIRAGVNFVVGPHGQVVSLEEDTDGTVKAVKTADGSSIRGDKFIFATGAWTASLVPAWNSMIATAQIVGFLRLTPDEVKALKDLPIIFNLSTGFFSFPPHEQTGYLKVACHSFGYTLSSTVGDQTVSSPPSRAISARANFVPAEGMQRLLAGLGEILPQLVSRGFEKAVLCWYNETPTGDFIFDYHPEHKNLFIATGGTGHAFKFLPVVGKYIARAFQRKLSPELTEKWRFHTEYRDQAKESVFTGDKSRKGGDGSRGGPKRREFTAQERDNLLSLSSALARGGSKI
ncbi:sarcosine oxidase [Xylogone sp. PMI_703]|nr:sarcosine oxidase [Xylogone sp. PMI_703]